MSTKVLTCDKCKSRNITDLNGELKDISKKTIVYIMAKCDDCGHEFQYPSGTKYGKRRGVRY